MKLYIQVEYTLDEADKQALLDAGLSEKQEIIDVIQSEIDLSEYDKGFSKGRIMDMDF